MFAGGATPGAATMIIRSSAFADQGAIPPVYTENGSDISPPLSRQGVPPGTRELALICDDPDAPGPPRPWVHWLVYKIPPHLPGLGPNVPKMQVLSAGGGNIRQPSNSFGSFGYGGPAPPPGSGYHRYRFTLYALDTELTVAPRNRAELEHYLQRNILQKAETVGFYAR